MARRPPVHESRAGSKPNARGLGRATTMKAQRSDRLLEMIDQCSAAKEIADELGEKFLSYLLAMVIQESRTAVRQPPPGS